VMMMRRRADWFLFMRWWSPDGASDSGRGRCRLFVGKLIEVTCGQSCFFLALSQNDASVLMLISNADFPGRYDLVANCPVIAIPELPVFLLDDHAVVLAQPSVNVRA
jgi:hypothetical protein